MRSDVFYHFHTLTKLLVSLHLFKLYCIPRQSDLSRFLTPLNLGSMKLEFSILHTFFQPSLTSYILGTDILSTIKIFNSI